MTITYNCDKCGEKTPSEYGAEVSPNKGVIYRGQYSFNSAKSSFQLCDGCAWIAREWLSKQPTDEEVKSYLAEKKSIEAQNTSERNSTYSSLGSYP